MRMFRGSLVRVASLLLLFAAFWLVWGGGAAHAAEASSQPANTLLVTGFRFAGNDSIETWMLEDVVSHAVGRHLDIEGLYAVVDEVTAFYRQQGYWLAQAYLPEQAVVDGVVLIGVVEGRYGKVEIENRANVPEDLGPRILRDIQPGAVIYGPGLESAILLLSDVPGVEANASLSPGSEPGTADVRIVIRPAETVVATWTGNNHGSESAGAFRSILNARWHNPRGYGDHFSFSIFGSSSGTHFGRLGYESPVNHRELRLGLEYTASQYKLADAFAALGASGTTRRVGIRANHPILRGSRINVQGEVGYSHADIRDKIASTSESSRTVSGVTSSARAEWRAYSGGTVSATLEVQLGSVAFGSEADAAFDAAGPKTAGDFRKVTADLTFVQPFGADKFVRASASRQWASKNLDSIEKMTLGGPEGVRAYSTDEPSVDEGWLARLEARKRVSLRWLPWLREAMVFVDAGGGQVNKDPWPGSGGPEKVTLAGGGVGLVWEWNRLSAELAYAVPIRTGGEEPAENGRLWWQATWRF